MKNQTIAAILMAAFAAPAFADNFETQVFNHTPEQQVQVEELSHKEMKETEGAFLGFSVQVQASETSAAAATATTNTIVRSAANAAREALQSKYVINPVIGSYSSMAGYVGAGGRDLDGLGSAAVGGLVTGAIVPAPTGLLQNLRNSVGTMVGSSATTLYLMGLD